ncbi:hypothetical protein PCO31111_04191 [Pandoraea communis]|uniref:Phage tail protein n=1 Tax=Pandoraea communis TaxID=2508297 RepID=A0A5E4XYI0_9BURK|nr:phage tail protein [Pandoraea communis]VVE41400.1 hypothetical protein PCO31111_04191 [Pandoraea communis]
MMKPPALRAALVENNAYLQQNPDRLHVFVDHGRIEASSEKGRIGSKGGSFRYRYTLNLIVTDYPDDSTTLIIPIIAWARNWQPDLLANPDRQRDGIKFEVDVLKTGTADVSIEIQLTEAVDVQYVEGKPVATYRQEPMLSDEVRAFLGAD